VAILVALSLSGVRPALGVFFPGIQRPTRQEAEFQAKEGYWATAADQLQAVFRTTVGGLAASFDYHYGTQDLSNTLAVPGLPAFTATSESELNTYTVRPEFVVSNWLSLYGIAALHEGTNRANGVSLDLDGWGAGMGVTAALGLPRYDPTWSSEITIDPLFIVPDFNWTYNEFQSIKNGVDVLNLTTRIGAGVRTDRYNWGLYAGPMYQSSTRDLMLHARGETIAVESEPKEAWSGVVGAFFGVRISQKPKAQLRPTLLATVEGGVGNRQGVLVSLRYEYDLRRVFEEAAAAAED
jgi:hypothetical protein